MKYHTIIERATTIWALLERNTPVLGPMSAKGRCATHSASTSIAIIVWLLLLAIIPSASWVITSSSSAPTTSHRDTNRRRALLYQSNRDEDGSEHGESGRNQCSEGTCSEIGNQKSAGSDETRNRAVIEPIARRLPFVSWQGWIRFLPVVVC